MTSPAIPKLATALLRVCCSPARLEEIEGDLHELFVERAARLGLEHARRRYVLDVFSVGLRQLWSRARGSLLRPARVGPVRLYLMRGLAFLLVIALLLTFDQRWAAVAGYTLLALGGLLELSLYVRSLGALFTALVAPRRERSRRRFR
jgi:hypothetical protein